MKDFASVVEIEINSNCNMACTYCPNSLSERIEKGEMDPIVFKEIVRQLENINYSGKIAFDFYNEPTLSKNFEEFTRYIKKKLPNIFIEIYSNGTKINTEIYAKKLIDLGIDKIIITKHEDVKKFNFEKIYERLPSFYKEKYELRQKEELKLSNRGGLLNHISSEGTLKTACHIPSLILTITLRGNVLPCFEDYNQTQGMGNIMDSNILEIWNSPKYVEFRKNLKLKRRDIYSICKNCNRVSEQVMESFSEKHLIGEEEIQAVSNIIRSGKLFRYKDEESECRKFEKNIAQKFNVNHAQIVTSGTNALLAALMCSGVGPGDEVIIPSYTFIATATAVINSGAIPVIVNIDEKLGLDTKDLIELITPRTKVIIPVHMDGVSCNIEEIVKIAKSHNLIVIEDACQAIGSKLNGQYLGTFGDFGCFSLNMDKVITAGEGGVIITNKKEYYEKIVCITDAGFPFGDTQTKSFTEITPFLGMSMRVSEITGVFANEQLKKLDSIISKYQVRKNILIKKLMSNDIFEIIECYNINEDCGIKLHLKFNNPIDANVIGKTLRDEKVLAYPAFVRRAHLAWQWMHMLGANSEIDNRRNPYFLTKEKYSYNKASFGKSISIIMNILILDIDLSATEEQVEALAEKINYLTKRSC